MRNKVLKALLDSKGSFISERQSAHLWALPGGDMEAYKIFTT